MKELSLHILDIVHNSVSAGANLVQVIVNEDLSENNYDIEIRDNGRGMSEEIVKQVINPFYTTRTTRKVGLGISLFKQNAEQAGGYLKIESELGKGTNVLVRFIHDNIDRPVMGDIAGVVSMLVCGTPNVEFIYSHSISDNQFVFDSREVKEALGDVPVSSPEVVSYLKEFINSNLEELQIIK